MHDNALTTKAAQLFPQLGRFESFYLVGGTALALQIGHRLSIDFDLFSEKALPQNLLQRTNSRSCLKSGGKRKPELRALAGLAPDPDLAAVGLDQMFHDREPEPGPPHRAGVGLISTVEPLEDPGLIRF